MDITLYFLVLKILLPVVFSLSISNKNVCITDQGIECCFGYIPSNDRSKCEECPPGYYGNNCLHECPSGQYGIRCNSRCNCTTGQICDKVRGCISKTDTLTEDQSTPVLSSIIIHRLTASTGDGTSISYNSFSENSTTDRLPFKDKNKTTHVFYIVVGTGGILVLFTLVNFVIDIVMIFLHRRRNKVPIVDENEHFYDEICVNRNEVVVRQTSNDNLVQQSIVHGAPSPYSPMTEYTDAYSRDNQVYLNPYNLNNNAEYTDHYYKRITQ